MLLYLVTRELGNVLALKLIAFVGRTMELQRLINHPEPLSWQNQTHGAFGGLFWGICQQMSKMLLNAIGQTHNRSQG